jgi:hypothetical protein
MPVVFSTWDNPLSHEPVALCGVNGDEESLGYHWT